MSSSSPSSSLTQSSSYIQSSTQYYRTGETYRSHRGEENCQLQLAYVTFTPHDREKQKNIPLLMVQGWSGVKEDWLDLVVSLATERPILIYDNREMGQSSITGRGGLTMKQLADDAVNLLKHVYGNRYQKFHILGVSMGGMIVQTLVTHYPHIVQSLIIGCSHSSARYSARTPDSLSYANVKTTASASTKEEAYKVVEVLIRFNYTEKWIQENPEKFKEAILNSLARKRPAVGANAQFQAIRTFDVRDAIKQIPKSIPVLVIHGDSDRIIAVDNGRMIAKSIEHAEYVELKGVGHNFWNAEPEKTYQVVSQFIKKRDKSSSSQQQSAYSKL